MTRARRASPDSGRSSGRDGGKGRRGAASLEFALIAPALLLVIMGLFEFSLISYSRLTIQKAAQMASRYGTTGQIQSGDDRRTRIIEIAESYLAYLPGGEAQVFVRSWKGLDTSGAGIENDPGGPCDTLEVSVRYQYRPAMPIVAQVLPQSLALTGADRRVNEPWQPCQ